MKRKKTLAEFIQENKQELKACIRRALGESRSFKVTKREIRLWILNDEGLYNWARSEGVKI